ncbi:MAG: helix-turn-helix domain-containing protein [Anaerolineales bacterium]|nr:helix-turn-helix domain-containing protein [Anaerolineales bacterium]
MDKQDPTKGEQKDEQVAGKLLSLDERGACEQLAGGEAPHNQRALALLAIDEGATQAEAGQRAGLTSGQVKYWLGKFRNEGLTIFPEDLGAQAEPKGETGRSEKELVEEPKQKTKKTKKSKKAQAGKKDDKPKKKKKKKKDKKAKQSKKSKKAKSNKGKSSKNSKKK